MITIAIGIALIVLGLLAGVLAMALMQISRTAEPIGIVDDIEELEEEELLP